MPLSVQRAVATSEPPTILGLDRARRLFWAQRPPEADHITATLVDAGRRETTVARTAPLRPDALLAWARSVVEAHLQPGDGQALRLRVWAAGGSALGSVTLRLAKASRRGRGARSATRRHHEPTAHQGEGLASLLSAQHTHGAAVARPHEQNAELERLRAIARRHPRTRKRLQEARERIAVLTASEAQHQAAAAQARVDQEKIQARVETLTERLARAEAERDAARDEAARNEELCLAAIAQRDEAIGRHNKLDADFAEFIADATEHLRRSSAFLDDE